MKKIRVLDLEKIRKLPTVDDLLDREYGRKGTPSRETFEREADEYYRQVMAEPIDEEEEETVDEAELEKAREILDGFMKDEYVEEDEEEDTIIENGIRHTDRKTELIQE